MSIRLSPNMCTQTGSVDFLEKYYDKFILDDNVLGRVNIHRKQINL